MSLMCWLRVVDDCFPGSNFASSWNLGLVQSGELATLQVDVRKFLARKPGWNRSVFAVGDSSGFFFLFEFMSEIFIDHVHLILQYKI